MASNEPRKINGQPPAIVIRLEFERPPLVFCDWRRDVDEHRLGFWLAESRPDYGALVARALEPAERDRVA
jgi:hypothetical protein